MTDRRPYIAAIIFIIALAAAVFLWQIIAVPVFAERERLIRSENAAFEKDIAEIRDMDGSAAELEKRMDDARNRIAENYSGRSETAQTASAQIALICAEAGIDPVGIDIGKGQMLSPAGAFVPALYFAEVAILFEGMDDAGAAVIRGLENSRTADFEVTAFVYRNIPPDEEGEGEESIEESRGEWLISALIYYYE